MSELAANDYLGFLHGEYSARPKLQPEVAEISSALVFRPTGASHASPGQRPGNRSHRMLKALQGRPNRCPNPLLASISTWSSAPRTATPSSRMASAAPCMPTWPPFYKISVALLSSSTQWKITPTCCSTWLEPYRSVRSSRMSKSHLPNGSKPKAPNSHRLHGSLDTELSPFRNPMWKPFANTSPTSANTIGRKPFKRNTAPFSTGTMCHLMNGMCGINPVQIANGAALRHPVFSANGAADVSPGQRPGYGSETTILALKGRPKPCPNSRSARAFGPGLQPSDALESPDPGRCPGLAWSGALPLKMGGQR